MSYSSSMRSTEHGSSSEPLPEAAMLSSASRENFASMRPASASPSSVSALARYPCADGLRSAPGIHERIRSTISRCFPARSSGTTARETESRGS